MLYTANYSTMNQKLFLFKILKVCRSTVYQLEFQVSHPEGTNNP